MITTINEFRKLNEDVNSNIPKITIDSRYDERGSENQKEQFDINYQTTVDGQDIEIEGILKPYDTGRDTDYKFEPGWFAEEDVDEKYYDEHSDEIESQILNAFYNRNNPAVKEGMEVDVLDMEVEALGLSNEVIDSLEFASAKLYELMKMSNSIKNEFPVLAKDIADTVEPMMTTMENQYPQQLRNLLIKFRQK